MKKTKETNKTVKFFWLYRALSYDLVFYYTVAALYYTSVKGFTPGQFVLLGAFVAFSSFVFMIPASLLVKKLGNTISVRVGSFLWILYLIGLLAFSNIYALFAIECLCSFGTCLKVLSDSPLIVNTLKVNNRSDEYLKQESKGVGCYFLIDCVAALLAGVLFNVNPYLPMIMCLLFVVLMFILSFLIKDESEQRKIIVIEPNKPAKEKVKITKSFAFFLLFVFAIYSLIMSIADLKDLGLIELGFNAIAISLVAFASKIINFLSARIFGKYGNNASKKFVIILSTVLIAMVVLVGIFYLFVTNKIAKIILIIACLLVLECIKQPYKLYAKNQLRKFSNEQNQNKLYTIYFMCEMLADTLLSIVGGFVLMGSTVGVSYLILVAATALPIIVSVILHLKSKKIDLTNNNE